LSFLRADDIPARCSSLISRCGHVWKEQKLEKLMVACLRCSVAVEGCSCNALPCTVTSAHAPLFRHPATADPERCSSSDPAKLSMRSILKLHMKTDHPSRGIWGRATWRFRPESMRKGETSDGDREVGEEKRRGDKQADCPDGRACSLRRLIFHSHGTAIAQLNPSIEPVAI
jgi:hypothetical protein